MMTVLHVIFGTVALIAAPAALFVRKGGRWHSRWGVAFMGAMAIVLFSAGFLWQAKGHLFLVPLGAVSAYLIYSGYRSVIRKRRRVPDPIQDRIDLMVAGAAALAGLSAAYLGGTAATPLLVSIKPALIGIGSIAIAFAMNDALGMTSPRTRLGWLLSHFSGMIAAYVSAVTAFIVINAHDVPMMLRWIVPSALGATTIAGFTLRYLVPALRAPRVVRGASSPESSWRTVAPATPPPGPVRLG